MKFVSPLRILCFTVATLRTPFFICRAACAIDARPPHHMHNGMARSRIARHPIFHMSRDIRIIRISPCEVAQLHTTKQTIRIGNTESQNELGPFRGPKAFWDLAISRASASVVFVLWRPLTLMMAAGSMWPTL